MSLLPRADQARIVAALRKFVKDLLQDEAYNYVIPVERKGTALIRSAFGDLGVNQWHRIISSEALEGASPVRPPQRLLILDDAVRRGIALKRTRDEVAKAWPNAEIFVASFITHRTAPARCADIVYYQNLDDDSYMERRNAVMEHLQAEGSLLLDTEHVEVKAEIACSADDFFLALANWGTPVRFASSANRVNCTVFLESETLACRLGDVVPTFAEFTGAVCKIRVIASPSRANSFAIIPILYPMLRLPDGTRYMHPRMKWTQTISGPRRLFQCVGLSLSLQLMTDLMTWIRQDLGDSVKFEFEAGLEHLKVVFPEIRLNEMIDEIRHGMRRNRVGCAGRRGHVDDPGSDILGRLAEEILKRCFDRTSPETGFFRKLGLGEILKIADWTGQTPARVSAALDTLIDDARILPGIECVEHGTEIHVKRVFRPDGEIVSRDVLRRALLDGRGSDLDYASSCPSYC